MARAAIDMLKNWDGEVAVLNLSFIYEQESRVAAKGRNTTREKVKMNRCVSLLTAIGERHSRR